MYFHPYEVLDWPTHTELQECLFSDMRSPNIHFYTKVALQRNTGSKLSEIFDVNSTRTYLSHDIMNISHASIITLRLQGLVYDDSSLFKAQSNKYLVLF